MLPPAICRPHASPADIAQARDLALATVDAGSASTEDARRAAWDVLRTHGARRPLRVISATDDAPESDSLT